MSEKKNEMLKKYASKVKDVTLEQFTQWIELNKTDVPKCKEYLADIDSNNEEKIKIIRDLILNTVTKEEHKESAAVKDNTDNYKDKYDDLLGHLVAVLEDNNKHTATTAFYKNLDLKEVLKTTIRTDPAKVKDLLLAMYEDKATPNPAKDEPQEKKELPVEKSKEKATGVSANNLTNGISDDTSDKTLINDFYAQILQMPNTSDDTSDTNVLFE